MWELIVRSGNSLRVERTENERLNRSFCTHTHVSLSLELEMVPVLVVVELTKPTNAEAQGK